MFTAIAGRDTFRRENQQQLNVRIQQMRTLCSKGFIYYFETIFVKMLVLLMLTSGLILEKNAKNNFVQKLVR